MSIKFALVLLIAFVGVQHASGTLHLAQKAIKAIENVKDCKKSFFDPLQHPVTFLGKMLNLSPLKGLRKVLGFPINIILRIMRIILTPLRILLFPLHVIRLVLRTLLSPLRAIKRFILNILLILPIIRIPVRIIYGIWKTITFPLSALKKGVTKVVGHPDY